MVLIALLFLPCMVVAMTVALPVLLFVTSVVAMPFLLWYQNKREANQNVAIDHASSLTASARRFDTPEESAPYAFHKIQSDPSILRASRVSSSRCIRKSVSFQTHVFSESPVREPYDVPPKQKHCRSSPALRSSSWTVRADCGSNQCNRLASTIDLREEMKHEFDRLDQYFPRPIPLGHKLDQW